MISKVINEFVVIIEYESIRGAAAEVEPMFDYYWPGIFEFMSDFFQTISRENVSTIGRPIIRLIMASSSALFRSDYSNCAFA